MFGPLSFKGFRTDPCFDVRQTDDSGYNAY